VKVLCCFDLDDTLYREFDYMRSAITYAGDQLLEPELSHIIWECLQRRFLLGQRDSLLQGAFNDAGMAELGDRILGRFIELYREHFPTITLHPQIHALLKSLKEDNNVSIALITDGDPHRQRSKVKALQLERLVDNIIFTGELGPDRGKPHPEGFHLILKSVPSGTRVVFVADNSLKDFDVPLVFGWQCAQVIYDTRVHLSPKLVSLPQLYTEYDIAEFCIEAVGK
jgi:putative hydrolase of the HAD superfamily